MTCRYCERPARARGLCLGHYKRWHRKAPVNDRPLRGYVARSDARVAAVLAVARRLGLQAAARSGAVPVKTVHNWLRRVGVG